MITTSPPDASAISAVERTVNNFRDDLRAERWRQFTIATFIYAVLGAAISALLAKDILQALVIGAGWTGLIGSLGLKRDYAERKEVKDTALEKAMERVKKAEQIVKNTGNVVLIEALPDDPLEADAKMAKAL